MPISPRGRTMAAVVGAALVSPAFHVMPASAVPSVANNLAVFTEQSADTSALRLRALDGSLDVVLAPAMPDVYDYDAVLSPDATQVVFETDRIDPTGGLAIVDVADPAGTLRSLTFDAGQADYQPTFSADGSTVLFTRADQMTGEDAIYAVPVAGGAAVQVGAYEGTDAEVNAAGQLVFTGTDGGLFLGNTAGDPATDLGVDGDGATWSPDGTQLAYVGDDAPVLGDEPAPTGGPRLHVVRPDGSGDRALPVADQDGALLVDYPQWLPDGQSLVFDGATLDYAYQLHTVDQAGTRAGRLFPEHEGSDQYEADVAGPAPADVVNTVGALRFLPVAPARIFDSRPDELPVTGTKGQIGAGESVDVQVTGVGGVPAAAQAVVLNLTAVGASAPASFVTAYPTGGGVPATSSLNPTAGADISNLVTVPIGDDGQVTLYNNLGVLDLAADVTGYYVDGDPQDSTGYEQVAVNRVYDSRPDELPATGPKLRLGPGETVDVTVADGAVVPATASAVVVNLTGVGPTATSYLTAYPTPATGEDVPATSTVNLEPGGDAANAAVVPVGDGGRIRIRNNAGTTDVVVDLSGYYDTDSFVEFFPVAPTRFLDTRSGLGGAPATVDQEEYVDLLLRDYRGLPGQVIGVVANLTGVAPSEQTTFRAFPAGEPTALVSNLNLRAGEVRANAAYLGLSQPPYIRLYNDRGSVDVVADVSGYFIDLD